MYSKAQSSTTLNQEGEEGMKSKKKTDQECENQCLWLCQDNCELFSDDLIQIYKLNKVNFCNEYWPSTILKELMQLRG